MGNGSEIRYLGSLPGACDETTIAGARQLRTVETSGATPESIKRWVHLSLPGLLGRLSLFLPSPPPQHRISDAGQPFGVRDSSTQVSDTHKKEHVARQRAGKVCRALQPDVEPRKARSMGGKGSLEEGYPRRPPHDHPTENTHYYMA